VTSESAHESEQKAALLSRNVIGEFGGQPDIGAEHVTDMPGDRLNGSGSDHSPTRFVQCDRIPRGAIPFGHEYQFAKAAREAILSPDQRMNSGRWSRRSTYWALNVNLGVAMVRSGPTIQTR